MNAEPRVRRGFAPMSRCGGDRRSVHAILAIRAPPAFPRPPNDPVPRPRMDKVQTAGPASFELLPVPSTCDGASRRQAQTDTAAARARQKNEAPTRPNLRRRSAAQRAPRWVRRSSRASNPLTRFGRGASGGGAQRSEHRDGFGARQERRIHLLALDVARPAAERSAASTAMGSALVKSVESTTRFGLGRSASESCCGRLRRLPSCRRSCRERTSRSCGLSCRTRGRSAGARRR